jgi:glycosyltransferase involved in cell wall biosynthesis
MPTVLYLGRVKKYKRVPLLIAMMKSVREHVKDAELFIAGGGDAVVDSREAIERMGAGDYVRYVGFVSEEEKLRLFQEAWVQATASLVEGWGLTVVEANACGTPAVSFRVPGLSESIIDGETGLLADDEEEFTSHLVDILTNEGLRERLTRGAVDWARRFDWDTTATETLSVLREVMGGPAAPGEGPA